MSGSNCATPTCSLGPPRAVQPRNSVRNSARRSIAANKTQSITPALFQTSRDQPPLLDDQVPTDRSRPPSRIAEKARIAAGRFVDDPSPPKHSPEEKGVHFEGRFISVACSFPAYCALFRRYRSLRRAGEGHVRARAPPDRSQTQAQVHWPGTAAMGRPSTHRV